MKPISFERFTKAINNFLEHISNHTDEEDKLKIEPDSPDFIFLKADKKHYKINLSDIQYFESLGDYVIVLTN